MGRPITKKFFGAVGDDIQPTIPARVKIGSNSAGEGYILSQRSIKKFKVREGSNEGICSLVNKSMGNLADNEMNITAIVTNGSAVRIKKMSRHLAVDYNNNRYTWSVEDDSTQSILRLVAL